MDAESQDVLPMSPGELKKRMDKGEVECLLDVREDWEHSLSALPDSIHIPLGELIDRFQELAFEEEIVVYCHFGERSFRAGKILKESGVNTVYNLIGGIDAYSQIADPSIPRYRSQI
ncbi:rhodanese-like domain-containing protein [Nitrospina watsonii]|uniref:Rhodanese-like domain protein n=1 Tax=Nitrospina watsonii TaxID=1323948 RepID=A0ABM9HBA7_9BACT|nr:rhodanese-like domain-containing protein [Nitrospina watsonii]CAI2717397.1 Rhodanese-like domain protein [Nitrospina watsonii]